MCIHDVCLYTHTGSVNQEKGGNGGRIGNDHGISEGKKI